VFFEPNRFQMQANKAELYQSLKLILILFNLLYNIQFKVILN